jgi:hypothetical protein
MVRRHRIPLTHSRSDSIRNQARRTRFRRSYMLSIFSIVPIAPRNDPKWNEARFRGEVLVRAESGTEARAIAAAAPNIGSHHFHDETLYVVREVNYGEGFLAAGPRGVISVCPRTTRPRYRSPPQAHRRFYRQRFVYWTPWVPSPCPSARTRITKSRRSSDPYGLSRCGRSRGFRPC